MKTGLVLGKFAPLHKGHQYLIECAIAHTDHLVALIYDCPETIDVPLEKRINWLKVLYPEIEVIPALDGPQEVGYTPEIKSRHEKYIISLLNGRKITHFFCSEPYGEHMSAALGAKDCRVDQDRSEIPVSATQIRADYFGNREWIHPVVYRDLIKKVVFLGAPSTGKTTLAQTMAEKMNTEWMPEYGRTYWEEHQVDRRLTPEQLVEIAETHLKLEEEKVLESKGYLFVDTSALTTYHFAMDYHGFALDRLQQMAQASCNRYAYTFLCGDDIPYDDTWDRSGAVHREEFQKMICEDLDKWGVSYTPLNGNLEERCKTVLERLA